MILPSFVLPTYRNTVATQMGLDRSDQCFDPDHFAAYPVPVVYEYNSRGYRDQEWPQDLDSAVWCFGDSFTVGLGSAVQHTWWHQLTQLSHHRVINISMNGASNDWIARKVTEMSLEVRPRAVAIHWSYLHRRESQSCELEPMVDQLWCKFYQLIKDPGWPQCDHFREFNQLPQYIQQEILEQHVDLERDYWFRSDYKKIIDEHRMQEFDVNATPQQDMDNLIQAMDQVESLGLNVIHSFVPGFAPNDAIQNKIQQHARSRGRNVVCDLKRLDRARDGHHYDILTARWLAAQIALII
jgi:hypothetical protein